MSTNIIRITQVPIGQKPKPGGGTLRVAALAALLLMEIAVQSMAQLPPPTLPNPCLLPVTSAYVNANYLQPIFDGGQEFIDNYPYAVNDAFFADPPPNFWGGANGGIYNVPLSPLSPDPSENMLPISQESGVLGNASSSFAAFLVQTNVLYLAIPCYWQTGATNQNDIQVGDIYNPEFSYVHFQVKVEAATWTGTNFATNLDDSAAWTLVANAGLDILADAHDTPGTDILPSLLASDTVMTWNGSAWSITAAPGQSVFVVGSTPSAPGECVFVIGIVLPQVVNTLHVGIQARDYTTDEDQGYPNPNPGDETIGVSYPDPLYFQVVGDRDTQGLGTIAQEPNDTSYWDYSPPFTVAIMPTALDLDNEVPVGIIYNPPGNLSSMSYSTQNSYSLTMQFMTSQQTQAANVQSENFNFATSPSGASSFLKQSLPISFTAGITSGATTTDTTSDTAANSTTYTLGANLTIGTTIGAAEKDYYVPPPGDKYASVWQEPFWYDEIVVVPRPIIAKWNIPASGTGTGPAFSAAQLVGLVGSPSPTTFQLWQLYCAWRNNTSASAMYFDASNDTEEVLTVGPQECLALCNLDPFFAGGMWQGADPTKVYNGRFSYVYAFNDLTPEKETFTLATSAGITINSSQSGFMSQQFGQSSGANFSLFGSTATATDTQTGTTTLNYQNQQSGAFGQTVTTMGTLEDSAGFGNGNASLVLYYDNLFNTICVRDTYEPNPAASPTASDFPSFCPFTVAPHHFIQPPTLNQIYPQAPPAYPVTIPQPPFFITPPLVHQPPRALAVPLPPIGPHPPPPVAVQSPQPPIALQAPIVPPNLEQLSIFLPPISP